ncbi:hypothetical protein FA95DRAFT_1551723 [Auriscalpium vulgare]|uniref:Uncharacterized protein n=1 Tax=Auriscalpium vulgare TaxID=40419 RepID=A0ACB8SE03_9AGAM|nr:hypothetical protein FA95DRAFT_1551723 [Auriscalpium vulgare]
MARLRKTSCQLAVLPQLMDSTVQTPTFLRRIASRGKGDPPGGPSRDHGFCRLLRG